MTNISPTPTIRRRSQRKKPLNISIADALNHRQSFILMSSFRSYLNLTYQPQLGDILVIHYTAFIDESSAEGSIGSLVDTTYNEFKREHRHDLMGHKHRFVSLLKLYRSTSLTQSKHY